MDQKEEVKDHMERNKKEENDNSCIEVSHLTKRYGTRAVVKDLSFVVEKGEVFGLLGHNGAGKSTTIDCILGLRKKNEGTVTLLGVDPMKKRKQLFDQIGVQLQASSYQANIRVGEICEEIAALYQKPTDYRVLLKQFHLETFAKQPVEKLSGGERQKLSVLLALIPNPKIVFLDELTTGLDVEARREVWCILRELKEQGITMMLTSHYMDEVESMCDRIGILRDGKMIAMGTIREIIDRSPYEQLEDAYLWYMEAEKQYIYEETGEKITA